MRAGLGFRVRSSRQGDDEIVMLGGREEGTVRRIGKCPGRPVLEGGGVSFRCRT